jgi:hypothetical protein
VVLRGRRHAARASIVGFGPERFCLCSSLEQVLSLALTIQLPLSEQGQPAQVGDVGGRRPSGFASALSAGWPCAALLGLAGQALLTFLTL